MRWNSDICEAMHTFQKYHPRTLRSLFARVSEDPQRYNYGAQKASRRLLGTRSWGRLITEVKILREEFETVLYLECACDYATLYLFFSKVTNLKYFKTTTVYRKLFNNKAD